ncbi:MAG TPA: anhydro-N-acetylmuramic acid kinase [Lutibacter sp.]|nr:anhydro-N-acetylmuramic acid kinase [Lutibacter sp.]
MKKGTWHIIGLMSGTSLDGVDLAYVKFINNDQLSYEILNTQTISYSKSWKLRLQSAFHFNKDELKQIDVQYGSYLGKLVKDFIQNNNIKQLDFIASHGHTIFHKPEENYTLQIGDGQELAKSCNQKVICDFRSQDVALGGQGAPLVPIGDQLLFSEYDYCLNIGGFANISYDENGIRKAFDICPANIVLNHYTRKIGLEYDNKGALAKKGKLNTKLLKALNAIPVYQEKNSLGNEIVVSDFIPLIDSYNLSIPDVLHTFIVHFSQKIADEIKTNSKVLITGGGAFNSFLIEKIKEFSNSQIIIPEEQLIDYKEALIFGLLGLLKSENEINCLASVTKASKSHSSGVIFQP